MPRCHARIVDPKHGPPQDCDRCPELHEVGRCQLVRGHEGQHVIRYGSATIGWPDGEQRPTQWLPWAPTFSEGRALDGQAATRTIRSARTTRSRSSRRRRSTDRREAPRQGRDSAGRPSQQRRKPSSPAGWSTTLLCQLLHEETVSGDRKRLHYDPSARARVPAKGQWPSIRIEWQSAPSALGGALSVPAASRVGGERRGPTRKR
jgi:hypothetical protein